MVVPTAGGSPTDPAALVERTEQLAELERWRQDAAGGSGRVVLIRGEAGIGKSALVRKFLDTLPVESRVFETHCGDLSTPAPFGALHDAVPTFGPGLAQLLADNATRAEVAGWMLGALSSSGLQVWLLEDLQWADDATLDLVQYLARRIDRAPALLLATYREEEQPRPALSFVLGDLATAPGVRQMQVPALTRLGVAALAHGRHREPGELYRLTNGNPFFVTEVVIAEGDAIPVSVRDAIRARLGRLDARAIVALQAAAVIGSTVEPWLLASVAGEDLAGIDDCIVAGVMRTESGRIAFRHELTRVTVLEDLPVFRGIGLHRRALDALRAAGEDDDARLAYHAEGAADGAAVLRHGSAAADRALAMRAHSEAAEQLRRCLRFASTSVDGVRLDLLEKLALSLFMTGDLEGADAIRAEAVAACRQFGDPVRLGRNLRRLARNRVFALGPVSALPHAMEALEIVEPLGDPRELALACCAVGNIHRVAQRAAEAATWSRRALDLGRRLNDAQIVAYALDDLGSAELYEGRTSGQALLLDSLEVAKDAGLPEHIDRVLIDLVDGALHNRQLSEAASWLDEMAGFNAATQIELCDLNWRWAIVQLERGEWDAAVGSAKRSLSHRKPVPSYQARARHVLAAIAVRRGDGEASELVGQADAFAHGGRDLRLAWPSAALHAEAAWIAGDMSDVVAELSTAYQYAVELRDPWAIGDLGRWLWRAQVPIKLDARAAEPYALQVAGDWRGAMLAWHRRGMPYEAALCLADSVDPADMRAAYEQFVRLGADATARRIGRRMGEVGWATPRGRRGSTRDHPAGLTIRQAEVADLAAGGLTDREIAQRLFLTEKTVSHHVSAVLGKLGARRRGDIASHLPANARIDAATRRPV